MSNWRFFSLWKALSSLRQRSNISSKRSPPQGFPSCSAVQVMSQSGVTSDSDPVKEGLAALWLRLVAFEQMSTREQKLCEALHQNPMHSDAFQLGRDKHSPDALIPG